MKQCSKCGIPKVIDDNFRKSKSYKDGYFIWCRECERNYYIEYKAKNADTIKEKREKHYAENKDVINSRRKVRYQENPEQYRERANNFRITNPERVQEYNRQFYLNNVEKVKQQSSAWVKQNPDKRSVTSAIWRKNNPDKVRLSTKKAATKFLSNPRNKLNRNISRGMNHTLQEGRKKGRHWETLVPYTIDQLKDHLEKQFTPEMSWENYGSYWHIDHIYPKSKFNYIFPDDLDFKKCWDLSNLQPLEKIANLKKHNKII